MTFHLAIIIISPRKILKNPNGPWWPWPARHGGSRLLPARDPGVRGESHWAWEAGRHLRRLWRADGTELRGEDVPGTETGGRGDGEALRLGVTKDLPEMDGMESLQNWRLIIRSKMIRSETGMGSYWQIIVWFQTTSDHKTTELGDL